MTSYVSFCVDTVIPMQKCKVYPDNKPWVSKQLKKVLNQNKRAYFQADLAEFKGLSDQKLGKHGRVIKTK